MDNTFEPVPVPMPVPMPEPTPTPTIESLESKKNVDAQKRSASLMITLLIMGIVWILVGIAAFIMSLVCFGYSGTIVEKILGFVVAVFFGPFYWLYYYFNKGYCGKSYSQGRPEGGRRSRSRSRSRSRR